MSVIPDILETRAGESRVRGQPRQRAKLARPYLKNKIKNTGDLGLAQVAKLKPLNSIPSTK
jgi:hypothetical protein